MDAHSPPPAAPAPSPTPTGSTTHWFAIAALAAAIIGPDAMGWGMAVGRGNIATWSAIAGAVAVVVMLVETIALIVRRDQGHLRPALVLAAGGVVIGRVVVEMGGFGPTMDFVNQMGSAAFGGDDLSARGYAMLGMLAVAVLAGYFGLLRLLQSQARRSAKNPAMARKIAYWIVLVGCAGPAVWFTVSMFGAIFFKNMGSSDAQAVQRFAGRNWWAVVPTIIFAVMWLRYAVAVWKDSSRISVGVHAAIGAIASTCAFPAVLMSFAMIAYAIGGNMPTKPVAILQLTIAVFMASLPIIAGMASIRFVALGIAAMVKKAVALAGAPAPATPAAPAPAAPTSPGLLASLFVRALPVPSPAVAPAAPAPSPSAPSTPASIPVDAPALMALIPVDESVLDLVIADLMTAGVDFHVDPQGIEVDESRVDQVMQIVAKHQRPTQKKAV